MNDYQGQLKELLETTVREQASDLHISTGHPPVLRIQGRLVPLLKRRKFLSQDTEGLVFALLSEEQRLRFLKEKEIDFSYSFQGGVRFRVNVFFQREVINAALRLIPVQIKTLDELNFPPSLHQFARANQGFILVTGPSGHGKSTTLAALIDEINHSRAEHIITIEDPIEYIFKDDKSVIVQREVYQDTLSFTTALR